MVKYMVKFYTSITVLFIMAVTAFYLTSFSNESLLILIVAVVLLSGLSLLNHKTNYKRLAALIIYAFRLCLSYLRLSHSQLPMTFGQLIFLSVADAPKE